MIASLFSDLINKYFAAVVGKVYDRYNGENAEPTMLHKTMLTEEYSADLTWGSTDFNNSIVAADVVALESSLPLKKRDVITTAAGQIPKLGLKYERGEKFITDVNVMRAKGVNEAQVAAKILDDVTKCVKGMDVRKEIMFEQALSTGQAIIKDGSMKAGNDGTGIRVDYGYQAENSSNAVTTWGSTGYAPVSDIRNMIDTASAKGTTIRHLWMSRTSFDSLRTSDEGKQLAAVFNGQSIAAGVALPVPSRGAMTDALADEFGITIHIVNGSFREQLPNGGTTTVTPWEASAIIGTESENVGRLVYGTLAEETNPVDDVQYEKSGTHVLISKFGDTDPLVEYTAAQALCIPVIDGVNSIYRLNNVQAITLGGTDISDGKVSMPKTAVTTAKVVTTDYAGYGTLTASRPSAASWLTVTVDGTSIKLTATANSASSAPKRSTTVTVTDGVNTATFTVEQAANT